MATTERILLPPEKLCMVWQQSQGAGAGLENPCGTCFLNAVLQCLTYTPPLANYLLSQEHSPSCGKAPFCMMCAVEQHVNRALHSSGLAIYPYAVINILTVMRHLEPNRPGSAHEILNCILDAMHRACLSGSQNLDISSQGTTIIYQIFVGYLRSTVTCFSCTAVSVAYEEFHDIALDITAPSSIAEALQAFVSPKQLAGGNSHLCSTCEQLAGACKTTTIDRSPNVLKLSLMRREAWSGRKINKTVRYPELLNLDAYKSHVAGEPLLYSLYAVLVHEGPGCDNGHFYCFIKAGNGRWYEMNDTSVVPCDIKTVLCQCAELLFYVRFKQV